MNPVEERVRDLANKSLPHKYVADHGRAVEANLKRVQIAGQQVTVSEDITQDELSLIEEAVQLIQPENGECFSNALELWQYNQRFNYAEGYASDSLAPYFDREHAWSMLDGEKIVDPTTEFEHYYGVVISSEQILEQNTGVNFSPEGIICRRENRDFLREQGYTKHEITK
jgi:hypothetical protein